MTIDFANGVISRHLGQISEFMWQWEGTVAEELKLSQADNAAIRKKYPFELKLQTYGTKINM